MLDVFASVVSLSSEKSPSSSVGSELGCVDSELGSSIGSELGSVSVCSSMLFPRV